MGNETGGTRLGQWLTVAIILLGILLLAGIAVPSSNALRIHAREAEVKVNMHAIQLAIERYSVDSATQEYPEYLIGGEAKYARHVGMRLADGTQIDRWVSSTQYGTTTTGSDVPGAAIVPGFYDIAECDRASVSDPLLRAGYVDSYPSNPFAADGPVIDLSQDIHIDAPDPLRNASSEGAQLGTRFGPYCSTMGQVLGDPRYPVWTYWNPATAVSETRRTGADTEYRCWDVWSSTLSGTDEFRALQAGQFFYKSNGNYVLADASELGVDNPLVPASRNIFILGAYGGPLTKGRDVLGDERPVPYFFRVSLDPLQTSMVEFWPWTRSQLGSAARQGSPYGSGDTGDSNEQMCYGNSNGVRDGLILLITAGEER